MPRLAVINPYQKFYALDGITPLSGGSVQFYENLTTTPLSIYSNRDLTVPQTNPYTLDAGGAINGDVFFSALATMVTYDSIGAEIDTFNYVSCVDLAVPFALWSATTTYSADYSIGNVVQSPVDSNYYISIQALNLNHEPSVSPTWWEPYFNYIIKIQNLVGNKEVAVGSSTQGLDGVAIAAGAVAAGNASTGLQATTISPGYVAIGNATNALAGVNINAKGSILAGNGTIPAALAAGTNGYVLSADSGQTTGLNWIPVAAVNGWQLLSTVTTAGAATVDIETGFSSTYDNYVILACNLTTAGTENILARWKLGGSYITTSTYIDASGSSTATSLVAVGNAGGGATVTGSMEYSVFGVNSGLPKTGRTASQSATATPALIGTNAAHYNSNTGVLSGVRFYGSSGGNIGGTFALYGVTKT